MLAHASAANGASTQNTKSTSRKRGVRRPARSIKRERARGPREHYETTPLRAAGQGTHHQAFPGPLCKIPHRDHQSSSIAPRAVHGQATDRHSVGRGLLLSSSSRVRIRSRSSRRGPSVANVGLPDVTRIATPPPAHSVINVSRSPSRALESLPSVPTPAQLALGNEAAERRHLLRHERTLRCQAPRRLPVRRAVQQRPALPSNDRHVDAALAIESPPVLTSE